MEKEDLSFRNIPDSLEVARIRTDGKKRDALTLLSDPTINPDDQDPNSDPETLDENDSIESHS